jgi:hypothetical protein
VGPVTAGALSPDPRTAVSKRLSTWIALGLFAVGLGMVGFSFVVYASPEAAQLPNRTGDLAESASIVVTVMAWLAMIGTGAALVILRPRNSIGWLLLVGGFATICATFGEIYVQVALDLDWRLPGYAFVDWILPLVSTPSSVLIAVWVPLLFPTGSLPGRRWRPVAWAIGLLIVGDVFLRLFTDDHLDPYGRALPNPVAIRGDAGAFAEALIQVTTVGLVVSIILAYGSVIFRFRRASGVERQQLKWFLASVGLVFVTLMGMAFTFALGDVVAEFFYFLNQIAVGLPPIAIGIAVLRYRLYDIDRLISRTIGWAIVTVTLVGVFALLVLGSSAVLHPLTNGNTLAVAGATLVVAALFAPLRSRVQHAVDRRFDRARYDGEQLTAAFGERLRDEVDRETIRADVLDTVDAAVRPASVGLWLRGGAGEEG